ncbi:MAG: MurT ligase domain-containing protein [Acidimicrobiales bacterium]
MTLSQTSHGRQRVSARQASATRLAVIIARASRFLHLGSGSVIGGRVALAAFPGLLENLAYGKQVVLVSGTNGKTTTTRMITCALQGRDSVDSRTGPVLEVATSQSGSNLPAGIVAALIDSPHAAYAVLEVDEGYLPEVMRQTHPRVVVLLNLSRDQLDRVNEVRMTAEKWRTALAQAREAGHEPVVVANCDDPMVTWAAYNTSHSRIIWVEAGQKWLSDASSCPNCGSRIMFSGDAAWTCSCGFHRPAPSTLLDNVRMITRDGLQVALRTSLPGVFNRSNAAMAATAASVLGVTEDSAMDSISLIESVEGRFSVARLKLAMRRDVTERIIDGNTNAPSTDHELGVRMMLAKNPAGWQEMLDLLATGAGPVVIGINAKIADGLDPSWLWDVPFESLSGRPVIATGQRCLDMSVRLSYAGIKHRCEADQLTAILLAASIASPRAGGSASSPPTSPSPVSSRSSSHPPLPVSADLDIAIANQSLPADDVTEIAYVGNYTAFQELRKSLAGSPTIIGQGMQSAPVLHETPGYKSRTTKLHETAATITSAGQITGVVERTTASRPDTRSGNGVRAIGAIGSIAGNTTPSNATGADRSGTGKQSQLRIAVLYPDILGTYGDSGNAIVLAERAYRQNIAAEIIHVASGTPIPAECDIYCIGGGEDAPQAYAAQLLRAPQSSKALRRAISEGAALLAVCAGYQILGEAFPGPGGVPLAGADLVPAITVHTNVRRAVGEILTEMDPAAFPRLQSERCNGASLTGWRHLVHPDYPGSPDRQAPGVPLRRLRQSGHSESLVRLMRLIELKTTLRAACPVAEHLLSGFENHAGRTAIGSEARPLGMVLQGTGNGLPSDPIRSEGIVYGNIIGTYLHGPVLARNPALADIILELATGIARSPAPQPTAPDNHPQPTQEAATGAGAGAGAGIPAGAGTRNHPQLEQESAALRHERLRNCLGLAFLLRTARSW